MMDSPSVWGSQDPTLSVASQDDFQFLDMGNGIDTIQFDFPEFTSQGQTVQMMNQNDRETMDTGMDSARGLGHDTTMQEHMPSMTIPTSHPSIHGTPIAHSHPASESLSDLDAQIHFLQQQRHQQQQRQIQEQSRNYYAQNRMIPPTPNSVEMHGGSRQFYHPQSDPQHQAMYERYRMQKDQEMAFTPLVSPAVTPLEAHFNIPEYTVPGAYFSPLSSPALHAQNEHSTVYDPRHSNATNSPIDMSLDSAPGSSKILARKSSKKTLQKTRQSTRAVRQSPIVKPQRKKKGSTATLSSQILGDIIEPAHDQASFPKDNNSSHSAASTEESENGSISPEHLSDMAPPPLPHSGSANRSPYVQAQNARTQKLVLGSPATPASLMRMTQSPPVDPALTNPDMDIDDPEIDGFALPEAANTSRPSLTRLDTLSDGQVTPTLSSASIKTGFQPLPSPAFSRPRTAASASQSPQIDAMNGANGSSRKTPQISARSTKKRTSSSVIASPALLPRISPSIKPLLPGGRASEDTASLLLASKSNYQNILEGTHLPGVSYPSELSTNLTSKRTSHKIAEQGRRNRINSALQEMSTLLPKTMGSKDSGCDKSGSGDNGGEDTEKGGNGKGTTQSANSKASTVENAIAYIKQLKKEVEEQTRRAEEAEKKNLAKETKV